MFILFDSATPVCTNNTVRRIVLTSDFPMFRAECVCPGLGVTQYVCVSRLADGLLYRPGNLRNSQLPHVCIIPHHMLVIAFQNGTESSSHAGAALSWKPTASIVCVWMMKEKKPTPWIKTQWHPLFPNRNPRSVLYSSSWMHVMLSLKVLFHTFKIHSLLFY